MEETSSRSFRVFVEVELTNYYVMEKFTVTLFKAAYLKKKKKSILSLVVYVDPLHQIDY